MGKKKVLISILALGLGMPCAGQLTIEECYRKAHANYPLIEQYDLIEKSKAYNLANAGKGYLPQISFSAKASYQSDVTKLPFDPSQLAFLGVEIPVLSKDQYGATIEVGQTIWDGGQIRAQKGIADATAEVEQKNTDVALYALNRQVNQLYFGILLADAQIHQNRLYREELARNYRQVESYVNNGIGNRSDLEAVQIARLQAEQNRVRYETMRQAYIEMLSRLIGEKIDAAEEFVMPVMTAPDYETVNRPELQLYEAQIKNVEAKDKSAIAGLMPKVGLFFTGGYGKPGLDMLQDNFSAYYVAGLRLSWNLGAFYTRRTDKRQLHNRVRSIELQRETFLFNLDLDMVQKRNDISQYIEQLRYDDEIVALRASVKKASEAKMANGTLSGTDFMRDVNAEQMAQQLRILHKIELLLAVYDLKFITNN